MTEKLTKSPASELGALKLDVDEIAAFEKWATEPNEPTPYIVEAAKAHRVLRLKQMRFDPSVRFKDLSCNALSATREGSDD